MEEKYLSAQMVLKKAGQEQLLDCYNILPKEKQENLLNEILTTDFAQIARLYEKSKQEISFKEAKIEPIAYVEKAKMSKEDYEKYDKIGSKIIQEGKYAVVTMAGGQGTRLGHDAPKGTYDLGLASHKSIFELLCDTLKEAEQKYGVYVPWYIMTSRQNNEDTIHFFEQNNYFGYPKGKVMFFIQGEQPIVDEKGKLMLDENGQINQAADGHGGIFVAMRKSGVIYDMKTKGVEWAFICGVDNVLAKMVDSIFVGLATDRKVQAAGKSVVKAYPEEKVGVFCKKNGRPSVIEYSEISKELAEQREPNGELTFGESHILCNLFHIDAIDDMSKDKLPYHIAHKKIKYMDKEGNIVKPEKPNAYKFETFLFDAFESL